MRNISNSEVTSWLSCRMQYYFAHYRNLEPKQTAMPLYRGTVGHEGFQRYAEARIDGKSHEDALKFSQQVFLREVKAEPLFIETILQTKMIYDKYMAYHKGWPEWRLLSVEQRFDLKLNDKVNMTIRYDSMVEDVATGKILIVDYKYTYDFWTTINHALNGQMPKYISVMNANGIRVDGGVLEELRTRKLSAKNSNDPKMLWHRSAYFPSNAKKINTMRQHIAAGIEITRYWEMDDEEREANTIPTLNKHGACKTCNFAELCATKLDGGDFEYAIELGYKENTYGYNKPEDKEVLL